VARSRDIHRLCGRHVIHGVAATIAGKGGNALPPEEKSFELPNLGPGVIRKGCVLEVIPNPLV